LLKRLLVYWAVLTLAPLLIGASLSLTSYLVGLSMGYIKHVPIIALNFLNILPILFTSLAFTLLFWLMPNRPMPLLHAVIGALVAAILFESMNSLFGYYIKHFNTYNLVYGAFASVPVFLMWIYLSWLITLLGAVVAASISHWHDTATDRLSSSIRLLNALRVLQYLSSGLQQGRPGTYREMSRSLHMGYDTLEEIINKLESGGMIIRTTGNGWMLMRDPSHIQVPDLLRLLVLDSDFLKTELMEDPLHLWVLSCIGQFEQGSDMSLQALFTRYTHDTSGEP
jgi:membrane protein